MRTLIGRQIWYAYAILGVVLAAVPCQAQFGTGPQINPDPPPSAKKPFTQLTIEPERPPGMPLPPKKPSERLKELRVKKFELIVKVQEDEFDVSRWESEVRSHPNSLTAPTILNTARTNLNLRQGQLRAVEAEIRRIEMAIEQEQMAKTAKAKAPQHRLIGTTWKLDGYNVTITFGDGSFAWSDWGTRRSVWKAGGDQSVVCTDLDGRKTWEYTPNDGLTHMFGVASDGRKSLLTRVQPNR